MKHFLCAVIILLQVGQACATSFGVIGEVFPVAEKSFLILIEERLRTSMNSGELASLNERWIQTVARHANRPKPLGLTRIHQSARHYYVPEIKLSQDITNSDGRILYAAGTQVNALARLPTYEPCWLFFNGDDEAQLRWAATQLKRFAHPKLILTGGSVQAAEKRLQSVIYFDQAGRIVTKLNIAHVPAIVAREGNQLVIVELAIKESGDVL
ncbi:type-F conjugative transfer system protein TraW [Legionella gresilensis]|uniref:type-F conjugative transfer system protein TraW n=1 Tax=Legionella gresilensis TaxID=91823 RepID=UPI0010419990|nr:type-F conjugative transfer system protein TraW [Legionella gresilensis]